MLRSPLPVLLVLPQLVGCAGWQPPLEEAPWALYEPGTFGVGLRSGLFTFYEIDGDFTFSSVSGTGTAEDDGDLVGRLGLAARAEYVLTENLKLHAGADYRKYDIDELNPFSDDINIEVKTVDSLQYFAAARYLFEPNPLHPRFRPFAEASVSYLPGVEVEFEVDIPGPNLVIDSTGDGYWVGGLAVGVEYHWTERLVAELGLTYEIPITELDVDMSFSAAGSPFPFFGEFEPEGFIGFGGVSYYF